MPGRRGVNIFLAACLGMFTVVTLLDFRPHTTHRFPVFLRGLVALSGW